MKISYFSETPYIYELIYTNTMYIFLLFPKQKYKTLLQHVKDHYAIESNEKECVEPNHDHEFDFRGVAEVMLQQSTLPVIIPHESRLHLK